ncbi:hypothetical protein [Nubsella zeaxanthinifaciens]|uniref:hypothetical protein n=1 Tax=Nubsella zeaxanthinifaciens TaxID=392412 RepID=UPI000DE2D076|nr:hypothetical protein [Nubsella zeaxanthinifaciens]
MLLQTNFETGLLDRCTKNVNIMEDKNKNTEKKEVRNDLIDIDDAKPTRTEENIEQTSSSSITTKFTKDHGRKHEPMGGGHEPGTNPGTGF